MKIKLSTLILVRIVAILMITILVIGLVVFRRGRSEIDRLTDRIIFSTGSLIEQRVDSLLTSAEKQGALMADLARPLAGGDSETSRVFRTHQLLLANPVFSSVNYTRIANGDSVRASRSENGSILIETLQLQPDGARTLKRLTPFGDDYVPAGLPVSTNYDPREESVFRSCVARKEIVWSSAYIMERSDGRSAPVVTCAMPIINAGRVTGVATVDFTLDDLSRFLQTMQVGRQGLAVLIEQTAEGRVRVIGHPDPSRLLVSEGESVRIAQLEEFGDPLVERLVKRVTQAGTPVDRVERVTLTVENRTWICGILRVRAENEPAWTALILLPESEYTGGLFELAVNLIWIAIGALAAAILASYLLANRLSTPLQQLADETSRIRSLEFDSRPIPTTNILEISQLTQSVEAMKSGLRSLQKLVPAEYAQYLLSTGQEARLGGERRHMTVSFGDLIGFTSLSEKAPLETLSAILAEYLNVLSEEVLRTEGTIDKFNGDDVMAFWGAPTHKEDHAIASCQAALSSQERLAELLPSEETKGMPRLRVAFGIATGDVIVGNVGSRLRMNYTVIGDSVNLASRLQGLNRSYGTEILVSEDTVGEAGDAIVARRVDRVIPQGKEQAVGIYELISMSPVADKAWLTVKEKYETAWEDYAARRWDQAEANLNRVLELRPMDGPAKVLLERISQYRRVPPDDDWTGAHRVGYK